MKEYILPFRDLVVHPLTPVPALIENTMSIKCIQSAMETNKRIILAPQHTWNYPTDIKDIFEYGTLSEVSQVLEMPDGCLHVIFSTISAVKLTELEVENGIFTGNIEEIKFEDDSKDIQTIALRDRIVENLQDLSITKKIKLERLRQVIQKFDTPAFIDSVVQLISLNTEEAIEILKTTSWRQKMMILLKHVNILLETSKIEDSINRNISIQMESGRREAILQEKLKAIQKEMGDDSELNDISNMKEKIKKLSLPEDAKNKALSEIKRLQHVSSMSAEGGIIKNYLDELLGLPWGKIDISNIDLEKARQILDNNHSGMLPVKERILEHIAVMKKVGKTAGTSICLLGAPGVGKTSLCKSIAEALGRKYYRISLGGISDESLLRGHRRTYIGSQSGRIIDAIKRTGTMNPVIVLDEIDKIGRDNRGDPESALLEILDPEQNKTFHDHYLDVDFDLSNVLFIATTNSLNISPALKDRMEIIEVKGYSDDEKVKIAKDHLIARAAIDTGWKMDNISITDDAIRHLIHGYTAEQGVRELQRGIKAVLRRSLLENNCEDIKTEFDISKIDSLLSLYKSANLSKKIGFDLGI